jgi:hypothetical protein
VREWVAECRGRCACWCLYLWVSDWVGECRGECVGEWLC